MSKHYLSTFRIYSEGMQGYANSYNAIFLLQRVFFIVTERIVDGKSDSTEIVYMPTSEDDMVIYAIKHLHMVYVFMWCTNLCVFGNVSTLSLTFNQGKKYSHFCTAFLFEWKPHSAVCAGSVRCCVHNVTLQQFLHDAITLRRGKMCACCIQTPAKKALFQVICALDTFI